MIENLSSSIYNQQSAISNSYNQQSKINNQQFNVK